LKKCSKEDLFEFLDKEVASYYPNSLCFEDKKQLMIHNNWFDNNFHSFFVAIEACQDASYEGKCKD